MTEKIIVHPDVNVDESSTMGKQQLSNFQANLPNGYYRTFSQNIKWTGGRILIPEVFYARALSLMLTNPDFDFKKVLSQELAYFPPSLFEKKRCSQNSQTEIQSGNYFENWSKFKAINYRTIKSFCWWLFCLLEH